MGSSSVFPQSPLGAVAAVLLIIGTVFLGRAAKGRRVARRALDHGDPILEERVSCNPARKDRNHGDSNLEETEHSHPGANVRVPDIFLSHSGQQKPFVERLYSALQSVNHTAFFDQHTLAKGVPFPPLIKQAAKGCKIGVIVLSEKFLTSKWPMLELDILVMQRDPKIHVLPLFYKLNPADLKSPEKLLKWRHVWEKMGGENDVQRWEEALEHLRHFNGEVYKQGTSEGAYINKVVQHICTLIPCHVSYDCVSIQGQSRFIQEIAAKFEHLDASQACVLGLHGVGGLGKTTLCKVMVNYYSSQYCGRSCLIEFPSSGGSDDSSTIASECKKALVKLTDANEEHLLNKVGSFDEVVQLMRDRMGRHDAFLAIDNVWESSTEAAKRVLQVGFSAKSKILVTSRSEEVLKDLLMVRGRPHINNISVAPLPAPEREEAFQIFQKTFEAYDLKDLVDSTQIDTVLESCRFSGQYHALALKALAKYVKRVCMTVDSEGIKHHLSSILEEISYEDLSDVEDVIRLNYDNLPEQKKQMFLDVVALSKHAGYSCDTYALAQKWIGFVHWQLPKSKTTRLINELFFDGLIQMGEKYGDKVIELHDLYFELAYREIAKSPRLLIEGITESVEKMKWEQLEIMILDGDEVRPWPFENVQQCKWPKLKLLRAINIKIKSRTWLDSMPLLSVLTLEDITLAENECGSTSIDSGSVSGRENVAQSHLLQPLEQVPSLDQDGTIQNWRTGSVGRGEGLVDASCILHLNGLVELRSLEVTYCSCVEEIAGLDALRNLRVLTVEFCKRLRSLDGLSGLVQLQTLQVTWCEGLRSLPDVSSLTCLERLELVGIGAMEEVGGLSCNLKNVRVADCEVLKGVPDVSGLTCLKSLTLSRNVAMEEVGGEHVSSTLERLEIAPCQRLRRFPSLGECMHLTEMTTDCAEFKSLLQKFPSLQHTRLRYYGIQESSIKVLADVGCFTTLEGLHVVRCAALEEIGDLSALHCLHTLTIWQCSSLKKLNVRCGSLKDLDLWSCTVLEEIVVKAPLESLHVSSCESLKKVEGISLTDLRSVHLYDSGSVTYP